MAEQTPATKTEPVGSSANSVVQVSPSSLRGPPVPVVTPAPVVADPPADKSADVEKRFAELDKAHARLAKERREVAEARKALKAAEAKVSDYEKLREERRRNPDKYLKADFGDDYYDKLTKFKVDGVPPAELIASEVEERTARLEKRLEEKAAELDKKLSDAQGQEAERAKNEYLASAAAHARASPDKYKLIHRFEEFGSVAAEVERHFRATSKQDLDGNWIPGETLTPERAAEAVEARIKAIGEKFKAHFADEQKSAATQSTRTAPPQRREQDPELNGEWTPPKNDQERFKRALAAGERHMASRQQH